MICFPSRILQKSFEVSTINKSSQSVIVYHVCVRWWFWLMTAPSWRWLALEWIWKGSEKSGYESRTSQQTTFLIFSKAGCSISVHWNLTFLDIRLDSGARSSERTCVAHISLQWLIIPINDHSCFLIVWWSNSLNSGYLLCNSQDIHFLH